MISCGRVRAILDKTSFIKLSLSIPFLIAVYIKPWISSKLQFINNFVKS